MNAPSGSPLPGPIAPVQWPWAMAARASVCSERTPWRSALLRSWSGTSPVMVQPPLDQHCIVMHLGGAKHVSRHRDGPPVAAVVDNGSLTLVPAGTACIWKTEGPIAFAHLYLRPHELDRFGSGELEASGHGGALIEKVGCRDELLERAFARMLGEFRAAETPSHLLLDSLLESFCIRLKHKHVAGSARGQRQAESLAPHRLRRVLEFIDANLACDLALGDLVRAAGTSQYHFSRAFHVATGLSPYRYLIRSRIDYARILLVAGAEPLPAIATACGFNSRRQFAVMFKRIVGVGPKRYRLAHASAPARAHAGAGASTPARSL